jgi:Putative Ig domain/Immunoglobulin I-set domain
LKPQSVDAGQTVVFTATAIGTPTPTVQWQVSTRGSSAFTPLSNGGIYSGVTTDTLTITKVSVAQSGNKYRAVFSNGNANTNAPTMAASLSVNPALSISNLMRTQWTVGKSGFTGTMTISGGMGPFHISGSSGLPTGLTATLSDHTIRFIGTPSVARSFTSGSITIKDAFGGSVTKAFSITINPPLRITTIRLPVWTIGAHYTATVSTKGGTGTVAFAIASGKLPTGLTLNGTGQIMGVSNATGSFTFTIIAFDTSGATFRREFTV